MNHRAKPRGFRLETRYTDERKERLRLMEKRAKQIVADPSITRDERKDALSRAWQSRRSTESVDPKRNVRLVLVLLALVGITVLTLEYLAA
ncbi:MAG: hypothetical protein ACKVKW_04895 [Flavobacteriales bacterium]|jgi:hypothetical protein|nr:hypothetical protein [Schleiferiaceae bacterium]|tara:strand:+ start:888 stop:1160 length:273 start_codon:yes stop_codon:yes gene_type:complete